MRDEPTTAIEANFVCIVCGARKANRPVTWHSTCRACGYESAALEVAISEQPTGVPVDEDEREVGLKSLRQENFREIVALARRFIQPGAKRLLDVGCAHGWFLETAQDHFDVFGIEPDSVVGGRTAQRGLPVRPGLFSNALHDGETFDVIVFNDVIEHIPDLRGAVDACHHRLNDDGLPILNLPNSSGFFHRLSKIFAKVGWHGPFERLWQKGLPSPHVHYFWRANLRRLIEAYGFIEEYSGELPQYELKVY